MTENADNSHPFGRTWKIAAGFVIVIVALALIGVLWPSSDDEQEPAPEAHNTAPSSDPELNEPDPSDGVEGACPELSTDTAMPTSAPDASWDRHPIGMIVPTSDDHGPAVQEDTFWGCYSQTPTGALYAGLGMLSNAYDGEKEALTDSPERDAFIESNTYDGSHALPTIEGFRVIMATEDEAVVEYLAADGGAEAYIRINLLWSESADDWRINSEGGQTPVEVGPINDRSAYISWR
jgi:hypothetical protein